MLAVRSAAVYLMESAPIKKIKPYPFSLLFVARMATHNARSHLRYALKLISPKTVT